MQPVAYSVKLESRHRAGHAQTILDAEDWRVRALELREAIDEPYWLDLSMIADDITLDVEGLVGGALVLSMVRDEFERTVRGVVTAADYQGTFDDTVHVRLVVRPAIALADLFEQSRVFQGLSTPEIAQAVARPHLGEQGNVDVSRLSGRYAPRDYCVQFRETDLAFLRRILAEDGIAMLVEEDANLDAQVLALVDAPDGFRPLAMSVAGCVGEWDGAKSLQAKPTGKACGDDGVPRVPVVTGIMEPADAASVSVLEWRRAATPAVHHVRAFDWKAATPAPIEFKVEPEQAEPWAWGECYRHDDRRLLENGDAHRDETDRLAQLLHERAQSRSARAVGRSNAIGFLAGGTVAFEGHPQESLDRTYLLTHVVHRADCPEADVRGGGLREGNYTNHFQAIPADVPYRPSSRPKPHAFGQQTATVIGPPGEEIHTDVHGRVQVWMHWDRRGQGSPLDHACWLRVAQPLAGAGFGTMFLPRVGMDVLVSFVDGDPDRPVCVGCLYDGANTPPYPLPEDRTKTTIKTRSSPGGGAFNELRFEDAKGSEQVFLHAQRNLDEKVRSAHTMHVGATQHVSVGADQTIDVAGSRALTVDGNQTVTIKGTPKKGAPVGHKMDVVGNIMTTATKSASHTAVEMLSLTCQGTSIVLTPGGIVLTAGGGASVNLTSALMAMASGGVVTVAMTEAGTASLAVNGGATLEVDTEVSMQSMEQASFKLSDTVAATAAGGASLELSSDVKLQGQQATLAGVSARVVVDTDATASGNRVALEATSKAAVIADATGARVEGNDVKLLGAAMATVQAPLVKVN